MKEIMTSAGASPSPKDKSSPRLPTHVNFVSKPPADVTTSNNADSSELTAQCPPSFPLGEKVAERVATRDLIAPLHNSVADGAFLTESKHALSCGLRPQKVYRNLSVEEHYRLALEHEQDTVIVASGALAARSYDKTGENGEVLTAFPSSIRALAAAPGSNLYSTVVYGSGRSPKDKRVVREASTEGDLWWGGSSPNHPTDEASYLTNRQRAIQVRNK